MIVGYDLLFEILGRRGSNNSLQMRETLSNEERRPEMMKSTNGPHFRQFGYRSLLKLYASK